MNKSFVAVALCGFISGCSSDTSGSSAGTSGNTLTREATEAPRIQKERSLDDCLPEYRGSSLYYFNNREDGCEFSVGSQLQRFLELHPELKIVAFDAYVTSDNSANPVLYGYYVVFELKEPCKCERESK